MSSWRDTLEFRILEVVAGVNFEFGTTFNDRNVYVASQLSYHRNVLDSYWTVKPEGLHSHSRKTWTVTVKRRTVTVKRLGQLCLHWTVNLHKVLRLHP